jgi:hypothetical protein
MLVHVEKFGEGWMFLELGIWAEDGKLWNTITNLFAFNPHYAFSIYDQYC